MFTTIAQGIEIYKEELRKYIKWTEGKKKNYGPDSHPMKNWNKEDYDKIEDWNHQLIAMEKVLGLTEEEVGHIYTECECGIK
jgi:hypothetical protein